MTKILAAVAAVLLLASCTPQVTVQNQPPGVTIESPEAAATTGISVTGTGEVNGKPDVLRLSLSVSVLRPSVSDAVAHAADLAGGLIATLEGHGVQKDDVQTSNYSIYPEWDYSDRNGRKLAGYRITNSITAKIRDLDRAGEILDAVTASVGDEVQMNGLAFDIEDNTKLLEAARQAAWEQALAKATQLASLSGVELDAPRSIAENMTTPQPIYRGDVTVQEAKDITTPIESGTMAVTVRIDVVFSIKG